MGDKSISVAVIISSILMCGLVALGALYLPSWGRLQVQPIQSITVVGEAKSEQKTQIAIFSAGANAYSDDKQTAVNDVNNKVNAIIEAAKEFGIKADDIKTQSLNIYQNQESYYEDGRQKYRPGQWNVGNTVELKLRDVDRASSLATVLSKGGATNVNGPNFSFDDTSAASTALIAEALANAQTKADKIAQSANRKLKRIINVTEGSDGSPQVYQFRGEGMGGGGGGGVAPGSGTVYKTVTVTFELE